MILRHLNIFGPKNERNVDNITGIKERTHHITELFKYFQPKKIEFDKSSSIIIVLSNNSYCENNDLPEFTDIKPTELLVFNDEVDYIEEELNEDIDYHNMTDDQVNDYYLNLLTRILKYVAKQNNKEELFEIIDDVEKQIRECDFKAEYKFKRFSKMSNDKLYMGNVIRVIDNRGEKWVLEVVNRKTKNSNRHIIRDYSILEPQHFFRRGLWKGNNFIIMGGLDMQLHCIDLNGKLP